MLLKAIKIHLDVDGLLRLGKWRFAFQAGVNVWGKLLGVFRIESYIIHLARGPCRRTGVQKPKSGSMKDL